MVMGLALLPPEGIPKAFEWLKRLGKSAEAKDLLEYYNTNWLMRWTPINYSVFRRRIRTNNDLEGMYLISI